MTFATVLGEARAEGRTLLNEVEAKTILQEAGIPATAATLAITRDEAVHQAEAMGYPVVLKVVSPDISHKSDAGGVQLNLKDADAVATAFRSEGKLSTTNRPFLSVKTPSSNERLMLEKSSLRISGALASLPSSEIL